MKKRLKRKWRICILWNILPRKPVWRSKRPKKASCKTRKEMQYESPEILASLDWVVPYDSGSLHKPPQATAKGAGIEVFRGPGAEAGFGYDRRNRPRKRAIPEGRRKALGPGPSCQKTG